MTDVGGAEGVEQGDDDVVDDEERSRYLQEKRYYICEY